MSSLLIRGTLLLALMAGLALFCALELPHYNAMYTHCHRRLTTHVKFITNPVCRPGVAREEFERAGLIWCSDAEIVVETEGAHSCALRRWVNESLVGHVAHQILHHSSVVWSRATGAVAIWIILPITGVLCVWIVMHERGETKREALRNETFSTFSDAMQGLYNHPLDMGDRLLADSHHSAGPQDEREERGGYASTSTRRKKSRPHTSAPPPHTNDTGSGDEENFHAVYDSWE